MRKVMYNTPYTRKKLDRMPKLYMVGYWADYGVREFPWSGKIKYNPHAKKYEPLVWDYVDFNGALDEFHLKFLSNTTTGWIQAYFFTKEEAESLIALLRKIAIAVFPR